MDKHFDVIVVGAAKKIMFYYAQYVHNDKTFLNSAIDKQPYSNVKIYNEVFDIMNYTLFNDFFIIEIHRITFCAMTAVGEQRGNHIQ